VTERETLRIFLRAHGYAVFVIGTFVVALPLAALQLDRVISLELPLWCRYVGIVTFAICGSLSYSAFLPFITKGRGTAFPTDPPRTLVLVGPYRYTRNPMYVGNLGMIFSLGLIVRSLWVLVYFVLLAIVTHLYITRHEEPVLEKRFGVEYTAYKLAVPRWLPALRRAGRQRVRPDAKGGLAE